MPRTLRTIWCLAQAATLLACSGTCAPAAPPRMPAGVAVITLHPKADVNHDEILISDVARVEAANQALQARIETLDLMGAPARGSSTAVSAKSVEYRLRMDGFDPRSFVIKGSQSEVTCGGIENRYREQRIEAVRATAYAPAEPARSEPPAIPKRAVESAPIKRSQVAEQIGGTAQSIEDAIVATAKKAVLEQLPWVEDDITFRLAQPLGRDAKLFENGERYTCVAELRMAGPPVGRVTVDVTVKSDRQAPLEIPVTFDVRHFQTVVATARPVPRGRTIQKEDLYLHRWDVTSATDYSTNPEQLIGRVAIRTLAAAQIVREQDLDRVTGAAGAAGPAGTDRPVQIKRSNRVKMIAKIGDLTISAVGDAMQDGRIGDTIRVQNVESKTIVQGKVISANEVEIEY